MITNPSNLFPEIEAVISTLKVDSISENRKQVLQPLIDFIQLKISDHQNIRINFICTHNSRRSHLSQIWAQTIASYFHIKNVLNCKIKHFLLSRISNFAKR